MVSRATNPAPPSPVTRSAGTVRALPKSASICANADVYIGADRTVTGSPNRANISQPRSDQLE
jgi:hypothetical protein